MTDERDALREQMAALAHEQWSGWMIHLFGNAARTVEGTYVIPSAFVQRWERQIATPYARLSEDEKQSDRAEADRVLALLPPSARDALVAALVQEYAALLAGRRPWSGPGNHTTDPAAVHRPYLSGGRDALRRVALRLGITDLHARAAAVVARGEEG